MKMNTKNLMVSFVAIVMALFLVATVSAVEPNFGIDKVTVDGITAYNYNDEFENVGVIAGETITVKVYFTANNVSASEVTVKAELDDVTAETAKFDVIAGQTYKKVFNLKVPYDFENDELTKDLELEIEIDSKNVDEPEVKSIFLTVQRPSYNVDFKSVSVAQTVDVGETFPVDIVLKNIGYNDLDDVYVTASIPALGVEKTSYFGDLVAIECEGHGCDDDETDTVDGRLDLKVPYGVEAGVYTVEVTVENDDTVKSVVKQIFIENEFAENVIVTAYGKTVAVGEDAEYSLLIVNPTNKLKVYRIVTESGEGLFSGTNQAVVAVPAGLSETVRITANADSEGEYNFNVNVFSGEELVSTVTLSLNAEGKTITNPIVVLTVILAIVFLVLLVVLIVLVTKKPEKSEEFGESYY